MLIFTGVFQSHVSSLPEKCESKCKEKGLTPKFTPPTSSGGRYSYNKEECRCI